MYFQVWQRGAAWYWHLRAANHEIVAQSEGYNSKQGALHAIGLVKGTNGGTPTYDA